MDKEEEAHTRTVATIKYNIRVMKEFYMARIYIIVSESIKLTIAHNSLIHTIINVTLVCTC